MTEHEHIAFDNFKFKLGQLVRHKVADTEGIVVRRVLVQAQLPGNIGRMYSVCYAPEAYGDALEIELENAEDDGEEG